MKPYTATKTLLLIVLAFMFAALLTVEPVQAQTRDSTRYSATPTWQSINYGTAFIKVTGYCVNDGTAVEDSIAIGFGASDTAVTVRHKIYKTESFSFTNKSAKKVWYRSLGGTTVPIRLSVQSN